MDVHQQAEIVQRHVREALVAQDAGIVDEDMDAAIFGLRAGDHRLHVRGVGDVAAIGHRHAPRRHDLGHHGTRGIGMAGAVA